MLTLMLVLAIPCCFIEYKLTAKRPKLRLWLGKHKVAALAFSTAVSAVFGAIFDADGLIVFGAGMLSTMIMVVVYGVQPVIEENKQGLELAGHMTAIAGKSIVFILLFPFKVIGWLVEAIAGE